MTKSDGHREDGSTRSNLTEMEQLFLRAARAGQFDKVTELLNAGVDINLSNQTGLAALHLASKEGHVDIVNDLIQRGATIEAATKKGNTALHIASLAGHLEVVRCLLNANANVNKQSLIGFTPLYMAAQENHLQVADLLLNRGANQALTTEDGFTPLAVSLQQGHSQMVALLLERDTRSRGQLPALHIAARKDDVNSVILLLANPEINVNHQSHHGFTPLHVASNYGSWNVGNLLLKRGADINFQAKNNITALHMAAKCGRTEMVKLLLSASALVDCQTRDGLTPLHCAARSGHADLVNMLVDAGASPSATTRNGLTPLHMAAQGNHENVLQLLIMRGASVDDKTGDLLSPLHVAAHCGHREVARTLLDHHCDVDARALNGFTPLHIACKKQKLPLVKLLIHYGASVNLATESGLTPLHVAAFIGSTKIVELLLQHGAHGDQCTARSETALHLAARNKQVAVARALIFHGAHVDAKANDGRTALHIAIMTACLEMINLLLSSKSDPNLKARDDYTAMHIAAREGHQDVIRLLLAAGADPSARTKKRFTPLHLAAKRGRAEAAIKLIQAHPKDVNRVGQNNLTPLHVAAHYNHLRVVEILLDNDAETSCRADNGYTPLHIAAKQNHMDIAALLLTHVQNQAESVNAVSQSGFTPLHLAAQEGHTDMVSLLLQHLASPGYQSKNGLAPLHLAAQENHVPVAQILIAAGAELSPLTLADYTPLHTACHFGQLNMVRYLLDLPNPPNINQPTKMEFTPLHLATQQGHSQVVTLLLEKGADTNLRNKQGLTPAHIARRKHFVAIFDVLKTVTTTVVSWEEEVEEFDDNLMVQHPDFMGERSFAESDDEAVPSPAVSHRVTTHGVKAMDELMDDGSPKPAYFNGDHRAVTDTLDSRTGATFVSAGENDEIWGQLEYMRFALSEENSQELLSPHVVSITESVRPEHHSPQRSAVNGESFASPSTQQNEGDWDLEAENVNVIRKPINSGFLISFVVDARGGLCESRRLPDLRFLIPPNAIDGPRRIVCRMVHPDRIAPSMPLNDGDGFACRVLELGPIGTRFASPIIMEIPFCAYMTNRNREIVVFRSENGDSWKEHLLDATDQAVQDTVCGYFEGLCSTEELRERSVHRILTYDLPQYIALVTRVRQDLIFIGPEGSVLTSSVVPEVHIHFPQGALQKKIRVGLQVQPIEPELVTRLLGSRVSMSPIVTIEPRRRKFHKPIALTIPLPRTAIEATGMTMAPSLRLLCSITGGTSPAVWDDITGSSQLTAKNGCVSFTTTVSARLWLIDCPNSVDVADLATQVYRESLTIPYTGRFVLYGRRHHPEEALLRCLCLTDDRVEKTLEAQEGFQLLATGPPVEVLEGHRHWIETAGNLVPVDKSEEQLQLEVNAFHENRLSMVVRLRDSAQPAKGKVAFMRYPHSALQTLDVTDIASLNRVTVLEVRLPDGWSTEMSNGFVNATDIDDIPSDALQQEWNRPVKDDPPQTQMDDYVSVHVPNEDFDTIGRSELALRQVAQYVSSDWPRLATHLDLTEEEKQFASAPPRSDVECAYAVLLIWKERMGNEPSTGTKLAEVLHQMGRSDVLENCMLNVTPVVTDMERGIALKSIEVADRTVNARDVSETSGLGTSMDGFVSPTAPSIPYDEDVILPSSVHRPLPTSEESRPTMSPAERQALLRDIAGLPTSMESLDWSSPPSGDVPIEEEAVVPDQIYRNIPQTDEDSRPTGEVEGGGRIV